MATPILTKVMRLDSIPIDKAQVTDEGYLIDNPVVTSVGIFEYTNPDGSLRRELRLPEDVFNPDSLASYEGKPVIITHDAGTVNKDNIDDEYIGTILSKGYEDGDNVRAKVVIHDTDSLKECGMKQLSLGYNLDLDETPGEWNGQPYDAIQRNISINHLAIVANARAGNQAHLNIDGKDNEINKNGGQKEMSKANPKKRNDSDLTPEQLAAAIEEYKKNHGAEVVDNVPPDTAPSAEPEPEKDKVQIARDHRDRRDQNGEMATEDLIAQLESDVDSLLEAIDEIEAKNDFENTDNDTEEENKGDSSDDESKSLNMDSVDNIISEKLSVARIGDKIGLTGLESKKILDAKKAIIKKVRPNVRLDGRSNAYVSALYDCAVDDINSRKDTQNQRQQMFNADGKDSSRSNAKSGAEERRQAMIDRRNGGNK